MIAFLPLILLVSFWVFWAVRSARRSTFKARKARGVAHPYFDGAAFRTSGSHVRRIGEDSAGDGDGADGGS